jgi:hypothetical protein
MVNVSAATESLVRIVNDIELAEQYWPEMPLCLKLLTVMRHRELAERSSDVLSPAMKRFVEQATDETLDTMVRSVVRDYVQELHLYRENRHN